VLDTSVLLALLEGRDPEHGRCAAVLQGLREDLVVPSPVLVELDYWLRKLGELDVWRIFTEDVAEGAYRLHHPDDEDLLRAADLEQRYADLDLGFVDASVIATCERLGETKVATLDRRHFSVVRPAHCDALTLLPG